MKYINEEILRIKELIKLNIISEQEMTKLPNSEEIEKILNINDNGKTFFNVFKDIAKDCYNEKNPENYDYKCFMKKINDYYVKRFSNEWLTPFENAKKWWKERIKTKFFYDKVKTNNNLSDEQTKKYIEDCYNAIDNSVIYFGSIFDSKKGSMYDSFNAYGAYKWRKNIDFLNKPEDKNRIFINVFFYDLSDSKKEDILVHELQHLIDYSIKPSTSDVMTNKSIKIQDESWNIEKATEMLKSSLNINDSQVKDIFKRFGSDYFNTKGEKVNNYGGNPYEVRAFITGTKHELGVISDTQITIDLLKPYILGEKENLNITHLLTSWAWEGYKNMKEFIDELNKFAGINKPNNSSV